MFAVSQMPEGGWAAVFTAAGGLIGMWITGFFKSKDKVTDLAILKTQLAIVVAAQQKNTVAISDTREAVAAIHLDMNSKLAELTAAKEAAAHAAGLATGAQNESARASAANGVVALDYARVAQDIVQAKEAAESAAAVARTAADSALDAAHTLAASAALTASNKAIEATLTASNKATEAILAAGRSQDTGTVATARTGDEGGKG